MVVDMNSHEPRSIENDIQHADLRHPVDFFEPVSPQADDGAQQACEALSRTFMWIVDGGSLEQIGLRSTVVLYCVRADLIGGATLEDIGLSAGCTRQAVDHLVADFCHTVGLA